MSASDMSISCESGDHLGLKVSWQEADNSSAYLNHVFGPELLDWMSSWLVASRLGS